MVYRMIYREIYKTYHGKYAACEGKNGAKLMRPFEFDYVGLKCLGCKADSTDSTPIWIFFSIDLHIDIFELVPGPSGHRVP